MGPSAFLISCGAGLVSVKLSLKPLLPGPGGHLGLERSSRKNARRGPLWPGGIKSSGPGGPLLVETFVGRPGLAALLCPGLETGV